MSIEDKLNKLDSIVMTKEDIIKLFQWKDQHKDWVRSFKPVLTEGVIIYGDNSFYQHFRQDGNLVHHTVCGRINEKLTPIVSFSIMYVHGIDPTNNAIVFDKKKHLDLSKVNFIENEEEEIYQDSMTLHASLMAYMEHHVEYVQNKRVDQILSKKSKGKNGKNSKKRVVKIGKKVYTINVPHETLDNEDKRNYERHTEGWMVKGFWRTSKNGKKTWINPYPKGNLRNIEPKTYKL